MQYYAPLLHLQQCLLSIVYTLIEYIVHYYFCVSSESLVPIKLSCLPLSIFVLVFFSIHKSVLQPTCIQLGNCICNMFAFRLALINFLVHLELFQHFSHKERWSKQPNKSSVEIKILIQPKVNILHSMWQAFKLISGRSLSQENATPVCSIPTYFLYIVT